MKLADATIDVTPSIAKQLSVVLIVENDKQHGIKLGININRRNTISFIETR